MTLKRLAKLCPIKIQGESANGSKSTARSGRNGAGRSAVTCAYPLNPAPPVMFVLPVMKAGGRGGLLC